MNVKKMKYFLIPIFLMVMLSVIPIAVVASDFELDTGDHEVEIIQHIPATPHEDGRLTLRCVDCGRLFVFSLYATGCVWGSWVVEREATCTQTGLRRITCNAGIPHSHTEVIPATGHSFHREEIPASCTGRGEVVYSCSECDYRRTVDGAEALGHDYVKTITQAPSCVEEGELTITCEHCDYLRVETYLEPTGHVMVERITTASTCLEEGQLQWSCEYCDYSYNEPIGMISHEWGDWIIETPPGEGIWGLQFKECLYCDAREEEVIEALPITPVERGFFGVEEAVVVGANLLALIVFAFLLFGEFALILWRRKRKKEIKERIAMERGFSDGYQSI